MNNPSETKRLADAVAAIAATITEIINAKVKESSEGRAAAEVVSRQQTEFSVAIERWVNKKDVAQHFKISVRTVENWMKRGLLPYIRTGKNVRFKLSEADETVNRRIKVQGRW
jgi:excisionase family DNA binding protein